MKLLVRAIFASCIICNAAAYAGDTDITVSITLTGPVDELIPLLEQLKNMGIGQSAQAPAPQGLEVRIHSVATQEDTQTETSEPEAITAFTGAAVKPQSVAPGDTVLITTQVSDPDRKVDTVVAKLTGGNVTLFDLYDNGTNEDEQAGDGTWSVQWSVPTSEAGGLHTVEFHAYDANGDRITLTREDGKKTLMNYRTTFNVAR